MHLPQGTIEEHWLVAESHPVDLVNSNASHSMMATMINGSHQPLLIPMMSIAIASGSAIRPPALK